MLIVTAPCTSYSVLWVESTFYFFALSLLETSPVAVAQTLTSVPNGPVFCNGSEVIFTCKTRGSTSIDWRGDDFYVGNFLGFSAELHLMNHTITHQFENTVATLTASYLDGGVRVLVSTLRILATSDAPNGTVTCVHTDNRTNATEVFKVISKSTNCSS